MMKVISVFFPLSCQVSKNILVADSTSFPSHKAEILCIQRKYQDSNICKKWFQSQNQIGSAIVNGTDAPVDEYPWFAKALLGSSPNEYWGSCGGMLVAPDWVLTALHCFRNDGGYNWFLPTAFQIGALSNPIRGNNGGQYNEILRIKYTVQPPDVHITGVLDNDFALVKLTQESTITPVEMDLSGVVNSYTESTKLWSIGFGDLLVYRVGDYPNWLQHVELFFVPKQTCLDMYQDFSSQFPFSPASEYDMCAGDPVEDLGETACSGDSGGPLYDKQSKKVVGVTSWGLGCGSYYDGKHNLPGVYAKISEQAQWIKETICSDTSADLDYCEGFKTTEKVWGQICDSDQDCYQEYKCILESVDSGAKRCYWGSITDGEDCTTGDECQRGACVKNECVSCFSNDECPVTYSGEGICFENSHCTSGRENEKCMNDEDCLGECDELCNSDYTEAPSLSISPSISSFPSSAPSISSSPSSSPSKNAAMKKSSWAMNKLLISVGIWWFIV